MLRFEAGGVANLFVGKGMIQINQCKLPITHNQKDLEDAVRSILKLNKSVAFTFQIRRRSIDARRKPELYYVYQLWVEVPDENRVLKKLHHPSVMRVKEEPYRIPKCPEGVLVKQKSVGYRPPVIIGAGPAGLFAAYLLTEAGCPPIVIEQGSVIQKRQADVESFWQTGRLDPSSNVLFGEGGAGTFSDGKLNTAVKDSSGRISFVLQTFVRFGAPSEILYEQKPHIGTDILSRVIVNMRTYLQDKGCEFRFETKLKDLVITDGTLTQIVCTAHGMQSVIDTDFLVLAIGHSARDTFYMLEKHHVPMEAKSFAVGFRVEHPQHQIDEAMYGAVNAGKLPAAPYKVTANFPNGRGVYSFCMCPGGYVVNSSSEPDGVAVNGMSYSGRSGVNANSAIIVSVTPADFGGTGALAGIQYQRRLEQTCYQLGGGRIPQQLFGDYQQNVASSDYGLFDSQTKGVKTFANLRGLFSEDIERSFLQGMEHFSKIIPDFDRSDAILSGVESRTSSPVRILRDKYRQSIISGLFPCGEGAGYAGGIVSAAADGLRVAEQLLKE